MRTIDPLQSIDSAHSRHSPEVKQPFRTIDGTGHHDRRDNEFDSPTMQEDEIRTPLSDDDEASGLFKQ
jgi:hypothetical protein